MASKVQFSYALFAGLCSCIRIHVLKLPLYQVFIQSARLWTYTYDVRRRASLQIARAGQKFTSRYVRRRGPIDVWPERNCLCYMLSRTPAKHNLAYAKLNIARPSYLRFGAASNAISDFACITCQLGCMPTQPRFYLIFAKNADEVAAH
jgi:hypothetical protein